jgi:hypothetical protein
MGAAGLVGLSRALLVRTDIAFDEAGQDEDGEEDPKEYRN